MAKDYIYDAVVRSIYDADTLRLDIDLGFNSWIMNEPIRLYGIDAPEIRGHERPLGLAAKAWLEARIPPGTRIVLESHKDRAGKYGRYLGILFHGGVNLNIAMIEAGHATEYQP